MNPSPGEDVQFADGFDTPDRLAFGLAAAELLTVAGSVLAAYGLLHTPLPAPVAVPAALLLVTAGAALGWVRVHGRTLLDWSRLALRFWTRPRSGGVQILSSAPATGVQHAGHEGWQPGVVVELRPRVLREAPVAALSGGPRRLRDTGAHRITFFSLKGGTGRTTLAVELAAALVTSGRQRQVALLDLDLRAGSVGARLGLHGQTVVDFATAPPDERRATDHLTRHHCGLQVLIGAHRPANPEWPVSPAVVRELLRDLDMAGFAVVVIDIGPELSAHTEAVLRSVDDVFIVVMPTASGVHDAYRTTEALRRLGLRHQLRYIINRHRSDSDLSEAMRDLDGQIVAEVPDDARVTDAENRHLLVSATRGPAAHALQRFARRLSGEIDWSCGE